MNTWAIVVAAGKGERFGSMKQLELLGGKALTEWSLELFSRLVEDGLVEGIVLVVPPEGLGTYLPQEKVTNTPGGTSSVPSIHIVAGGDSRSASVRSGLAAVPEKAETVVVHDAARPLASPELAKSVINAVRNGASAAIPALEIVDTIKEVEDSKVLRTLDRTRYVTVQTPQAFRANVLRRAHESGHDTTDDATLVEMIGEDVVTIPGESDNIKVTTPDDLVRLNRLIGPEEAGPLSKLRIGNGFDMHRFGHRDSHLVLGGINIPHNKSLMGHSDADVLAHAVIDAILGAAGLGDIGHHFPDTDPLWSGADSIEMLRQVVEMLHNQSYHIVNIDVTVIAESPILSPYIVSIQSRLSEVTGGGINVKATSPEGMGALGNEEGIACLASALIVMVA